MPCNFGNAPCAHHSQTHGLDWCCQTHMLGTALSGRQCLRYSSNARVCWVAMRPLCCGDQQWQVALPQRAIGHLTAICALAAQHVDKRAFNAGAPVGGVVPIVPLSKRNSTLCRCAWQGRSASKANVRCEHWRSGTPGRTAATQLAVQCKQGCITTYHPGLTKK